MTTISHNRKRKGFGFSGFGILAFFLILLLSVGFWRAQVSAVFWRLVTPALTLRNSLYNSENATLQAQLTSMGAALADRGALYQENLQLKAELGRDANVHTILASVLMRPPGVPYDTLLIDVGSRLGIAPGSLVFAGGTTLIGKVAEVYDDTARVILLSAPGATYEAQLRPRIGGSIPVALEGQGAGSLRGEVPAGSPITVGDAVVLPGIALQFVGAVSFVDAKNGESFETVYMQLPVNLFSLQFVEVQKQ